MDSTITVSSHEGKNPEGGTLNIIDPLGAAQLVYANLWKQCPFTNFKMFKWGLDQTSLSFVQFFKSATNPNKPNVRSLAVAAEQGSKFNISAALENGLVGGICAPKELWTHNSGLCTSFCIRLTEDKFLSQFCSNSLRLSFFNGLDHRLAAFTLADTEIGKEAGFKTTKDGGATKSEGDQPGEKFAEEVIVLDSSARRAFQIPYGKTVELETEGAFEEYAHVYRTGERRYNVNKNSEGVKIGWGQTIDERIKKVSWEKDRNVPKPKNQLPSNTAYYNAYVKDPNRFPLKWQQAMSTCLLKMLTETNILCMFRVQKPNGVLGFSGMMKWDFCPRHIATNAAGAEGQSLSFTVNVVVDETTGKTARQGHMVVFGDPDGSAETNAESISRFVDFLRQDGTDVGSKEAQFDGELLKIHHEMWDAAVEGWGFPKSYKIG